MEFYGTLRLGKKFRNFMELYNGSDGTEQLWYIVTFDTCYLSSIHLTASCASCVLKSKMCGLRMGTGVGELTQKRD